MRGQNDSARVSLIIYNRDGKAEGLVENLKNRVELIERKGNQSNSQGFFNELDCWELKSKLRTNASVEEHIVSLLDRLRPFREDIRNISRLAEVKISIGAEYYHYNPEIELEPSVMAQIAELGAKLWLDIYSFERDYLVTKPQQQHFKDLLLASKGIKKLGITTEKDADAIARLLQYFEENGLEVLDEIFPDYAGIQELVGDDFVDGLINARKVLRKLNQMARKSDFFSPSD